MAHTAAFSDFISNLKSPADDTRNGAVASLVDYCSSGDSLKALSPWEDRIADVCEDLLDTGTIGDAEGHALALCLCKIACLNVMEQADLDQVTLQSCLGLYTNANIEQKRMMLRAVRLFAVTNKDRVALLEETGWVTAALECTQECYDHAVLLLDALESLESLPGLVMGGTGAELMLAHVINNSAEREQCAGLRVASRVLSSLAQGMQDAASALEARGDIWLNKLYKAHVVKAVVACIERFMTEGSVGCAVRTLTVLSKHKIFLSDIQDDVLMRTIISQVLAKGQAMRDIFVFFRRVLTLGEVADAFSSSGGPTACLTLLTNENHEGAVSRDVLVLLCVWLHHASSPNAAIIFTRLDGPKECLALLEKSGLEKARGVLAVLIAWCDTRSDRDLAGQQGVDWSPLVMFLAMEDRGIVEQAGALILWNWYFPGQDDGVGSVLMDKLKEHKAIPTLLSLFVKSPFVRRHLGYATLGVRGLISLLGKNSIALYATHGVTDRLFELSKSDSPDVNVEPAIYCLGVLASYGTDVMQLLVDQNIFGSVLRRLEAQMIRKDASHTNLMLETMGTLLVNVDRPSRLIGTEGISAIKMLLKVMQVRDPHSPLVALRAPQTLLMIVICAVRGALDEELGKDCLTLVVEVLKSELEVSQREYALKALRRILARASSALGQTFIAARGIRLLRNNLMIGSARNAALLTVLAIARNASIRNDVGNSLARLVNASNLRGVCEKYPPYQAQPAMQAKLCQRFESVFGPRAALWA